MSEDKLIDHLCGLQSGNACDAILDYLSRPDCSPRTRERIQAHLSPFDEDGRVLSRAKKIGDEVHIDLWYPTVSPVKSFVIGLIDTRAADGIRVSYDHGRDGWKIEQASIFEWPIEDKVCDMDWQEVAFVDSWGREKEQP